MRLRQLKAEEYKRDMKKAMHPTRCIAFFDLDNDPITVVYLVLYYLGGEAGEGLDALLILGSLERLVLTARFNKKLLCRHALDRAPCFLRHLLQVPIGFNTYKVAEAHTGDYERRKSPPERTTVKGEKVRTPRRQRLAAAQHGTGLVAYLAVIHRRAEKRVRKAERAEVRRDMERIVHN